MVWFSEDVLSTEMIFENYLSRLKNIPLEEAEEESSFPGLKKIGGGERKEEGVSPTMQVLSYFLLVQLIFEWLRTCLII